MGLGADTAGLRGGADSSFCFISGTIVFFSGTAIFVSGMAVFNSEGRAEPPAFGWPTGGAEEFVAGVFGAPVPPEGWFGLVTAGDVVTDLFSGVSFTLGLFFGNSWPGGTTLGDRFVEAGPVGAPF